MQPPVVEGVTDVPTPSTGGLAGLLAALLGGGGAGEGSRPGIADLRQGIAALNRAAESDSRLADRIRRALDIIEGADAETERGNARGANRLGAMLGNAKTPI